MEGTWASGRSSSSSGAPAAPATSTRARRRTGRARARAGVEPGIEQIGGPPEPASEGWNGKAGRQEEDKRELVPAAQPEVTVPEVAVSRPLRFRTRVLSGFRWSQFLAVLDGASSGAASRRTRWRRRKSGVGRSRRFACPGRASRCRCSAP